MVFQEREVICCGPSSWTKVIAWFQIVYNVAAFSMLMAYLLIMTRLIDASPETSTLTATFMDRDGQSLDLSPSEFYTICATGLFISLIGFIMGVVLLQGAKQRNVRHLKAWIYYTSIVLICNMISLVLRDARTDEILLKMLFTAAINGFGIMLVYMHVIDISRASILDNEKPPKYEEVMLHGV